MSEYLTPGYLLLATGLYLLLCGLAGCYVSAQVGRSCGEGFMLALVLGPVGVVAAACLPDLREETTAADDEAGGDEEEDRVRSHLAVLERSGPPPVPRARKLLGEVGE